MIAVLSPAKRMNFTAPVESFRETEPLFSSMTQSLIVKLKRLTLPEISKMMNLSPSLSKLNFERFQNYSLDRGRSCCFVFDGETYRGLEVSTLTRKDLVYLDKNIKIFSGLYGLLRPFDKICPHRLEMNTPLQQISQKLFWRSTLTAYLNEEGGDVPLVNLASREYFDILDRRSLKSEVFTPIFKEVKDGGAKVIGIFAKRARGLFARYMVKNRIKTRDVLVKFKGDRYRYSHRDSSDNELIFYR